MFYQSWIAVFLLSPIGFMYYRMWKKECFKCKEQVFREQFKEAMQSLITALNVGYSIENAMRGTLKEMKILYGEDASIIRELGYIVRQLEMNITVEQALAEFAFRVGVEDVGAFVTVFVITKRNGGDMITVLRNAVEKICVKIEVKQEIQTLIAAKKMEFQIMSIIPVGMIVYMKLSFSQFMSVLYGNTAGVIIMSICLVIYFGAFYLGKTMLEIEV